ncbi:hypothetical protein Acid345_1197 [Candidatus Koribacter versatilis Ellin345]|uniref:DUF3037 domain-containing protein n=1 Tax=Koribacter versatilis (strain Ellin345) TaxID=204669 RepID=Q1ISF0_KORVE|nr:DUF3037 domain-containing protein [Candidatus Koribacter versatilis]ABF40200.1 hypothetical protein Acid345_1197 [Candidatus Koribacter versatilis Ellin345]
MAERETLRLFDYYVLRFVPHPEQEVAVVFGFILTGLDSDGAPFFDVVLTSDWRLVRLLDPASELDYFYEFKNSVLAQFNSAAKICSSGGVVMAESEWLRHVIEDSFSNSIRISEVKGLMAEDAKAASKTLSTSYFKIPAALPDRERTGVNLIKRSIDKAFDYYGIDKTLVTRNFKIAKYVDSADPSPIHYKYEVDSDAAIDLDGIPSTSRRVFRLIQAVSLRNSIDGARTLGYAWPEIREGMSKKENAFGHLTAVIDDSLAPDNKNLEFAKRHFDEHGIVLRHMYQVADMARIARAELRL